jgi:hypothetical protein
MDTRFWGPSGWRLLHLIAASPLKNRAAVKEWFELLKFVLPCKYCRASFHDYMELQPLTPEILKSPDTFGRWVYDIHNRVNAKLRGQGLVTTADPPWPRIKAEYQRMSAALCSGPPLLGWDFMVSIAYTTPGPTYKPAPMPDLPDYVSPTATIEYRNRYNLLDRQERIQMLKRWWSLTPSILPCDEWRASWSAATSRAPPPFQDGREAVMRWMWRVEEQVCAGLQCPTPHPSLVALKKEVAAYESDCGKRKRGKTCRTRKRKTRRTAREIL